MNFPYRVTSIVVRVALGVPFGVVGDVTEFERELSARTSEDSGSQITSSAGDRTSRRRRADARDCVKLQSIGQHHIEGLRH